jgi:hypothetical protein
MSMCKMSVHFGLLSRSPNTHDATPALIRRTFRPNQPVASQCLRQSVGEVVYSALPLYGANLRAGIVAEARKGEGFESPSHKARLSLHLLGQIASQSDLLDGPQLGFKPIDMLLRIYDHVFKHMPCGEICHFGAMSNGLSQ